MKCDRVRKDGQPCRAGVCVVDAGGRGLSLCLQHYDQWSRAEAARERAARFCAARTREGYRCERTATHDGLCWTHYQLASLGRDAEVTRWNVHLVGA